MMSLIILVSLVSDAFLFLSYRLIFDFMYLLSLDESDSLDDESDDDVSDSGSSGTYYFHALSLRFENCVGSVSGLESVVFVPTALESKYDIFVFVVFIPIGVDSKGG